MTRNTKIILGVVAGMLVLCMCAAVAAVAGALALIPVSNRVVQTAPQTGLRAEQVQGGSIFQEQAPLQYDMPSGWREDFSLHIFGFEMIGLGGGDSHGHIFLMQLPPDRNADLAVSEALDNAGTGSYTSYRNGLVLREVGQTYVKVRGQQVRMRISEGTNRDGETYRQWAGAGMDANGQTVVVVEQPVKTWDQGLVDSFISSIR